MEKKFTLIVAMGKHREIGNKNDLPWHLPADMQFFKTTTTGHTVIMGRKNWESIPEKFRPLPNRKNIILTRNTDYHANGAIVVNDISTLPKLLQENEKCFIIGGAQIFTEALKNNWVVELLVTQIDATFEADTYFPFVNWEEWQEEDILHQDKDEKNNYAFTIKRYFR